MRSLFSSFLMASLLAVLPLVLVESHQAALAQTDTVEDRKAEADRLYQQSRQQFRDNQNGDEDSDREAFRLLEQALKIYREIQNRSGEAEALIGLGSLSAELGQDEQALNFYQQALTQYREIDDQKGMIEAILGIGEAYREQQQGQQAVEQYQQAIIIAREIGDREAEIRLLIEIAKTSLRESRYEQEELALDYLRQALDLAQTLEDPNSKAAALVALGRYYSGRYYGDLGLAKALRLFQQARTIYQQQQDQKAELAMLKDFAELYSNFDQSKQALNISEDALRIARKLSDREIEIAVLEDISDIYFEELDQPEQGLEALESALQVARAVENQEIELSLLKRLSKAYYRYLEKPTQELETLQTALKIAQELEKREVEIEILRDISNIYADLGQPDKELGVLKTALEIAQEIDNRELQVEILSSRGEQLGLNGLQAALKIVQEEGHSEEESRILERIAYEYVDLGQTAESDVICRNSSLRRISQMPILKWFLSRNCSSHFYEISQQYFQQTLEIYKAQGELSPDQEKLDRLLNDQADVLLMIGTLEAKQDRLKQAEDYFQQGLSLIKTRPKRSGWRTIDLTDLYLRDIGRKLSDAGKYSLSLKYYEQRLMHHRELKSEIDTRLVKDSSILENIKSAKDLEAINGWKADTLQNIGWIYINQNQFTEAEQQFRQAIAIYQELGNRREVSSLRDTIEVLKSGGVKAAQLTEAERLLNQAIDLSRDGEVSDGRQIFEQARKIYQQSGLRRNEASALTSFASGASNRDGSGLPAKIALSYYQQALKIDQELGNLYEEATTWGDIAYVYAESGQSIQAIEAYQRKLAIHQVLGDRNSEERSLDYLGEYYLEIQQPLQAAEAYQKALVIDRETCNAVRWRREDSTPEAWGESRSLRTLMEIYQNLTEEGGETDKLSQLLGQAYQNIRVGQRRPAIQLLKEAIELSRPDSPQQAAALTTQLGWLYADLKQPTEAIKSFQQALEFYREQDDRPQQVHLLSQMGWVYVAAGQTTKAVEAFQQVLAVQQTIGNPEQLATTFSILGDLSEKQGKPELAIIFYKQFVNQAEKLRQELQVLPRGQQGACNQLPPDLIYRKLANLLLEEGRIPEAQQALDLLRLEELREFTQTTRATWTGSELRYTEPEQSVVDVHGSLIALGGKVIQCENTNCAELRTLDAQLEVLKEEYQSQMVRFNETIRANRADKNFQDPDDLSGDAETLLKIYSDNGQKAVLVYPFVLEKKLWLVWAVAGGAIGSIEVDVSQEKLSATVQRFGELLNSPSRLPELQSTSQQLYGWIIQPLEAEFDKYLEKYSEAEREKYKIDHLIFVNDRVTRYIPMAALYDGEKYLLERFTISTVLAPALTDTSDRLTSLDQSQVLGLGLTKAIANFDPLPAVSEELDAIVRSDQADPIGTYPGQVFFNENFTLNLLKENVRNYRILHLATHAAFVPGRAEESFVLLGDGSKLTIADIEVMERRLSNLHLVVLSACQTALGGPAGDGTEIAGISSYFLKNGRAETVIASLWKVNDDSTSLLMQQLYQNLAQGMTKAEALQKAQLSLLNGQTTRNSQSVRSDVNVTPNGGIAVMPAPDTVIEAGYAHPYYWAPFILIGNGL